MLSYVTTDLQKQIVCGYFNALLLWLKSYLKINFTKSNNIKEYTNGKAC